MAGMPRAATRAKADIWGGPGRNPSVTQSLATAKEASL